MQVLGQRNGTLGTVKNFRYNFVATYMFCMCVLAKSGSCFLFLKEIHCIKCRTLVFRELWIELVLIAKNDIQLTGFIWYYRVSYTSGI